MQRQRWARIFEFGDYQVAYYICQDQDGNLGLVTTAMFDDDMVGESEVYPGEDIDQIRARLDAITLDQAKAWLGPMRMS